MRLLHLNPQLARPAVCGREHPFNITMTTVQMLKMHIYYFCPRRRHCVRHTFASVSIKPPWRTSSQQRRNPSLPEGGIGNNLIRNHPPSRSGIHSRQTGGGKSQAPNLPPIRLLADASRVAALAGPNREKRSDRYLRVCVPPPRLLNMHSLKLRKSWSTC